MSEAWREVARLGKKGEQYPHVLADSCGWCLRLGPRDREDNKFYSTLPALLQGLLEHLVRRKDREGARGGAELKALLLQNLKEARELGEELERKITNLRQRFLEAADNASMLVESKTPPSAARIAADVSELGSEVA